MSERPAHAEADAGMTAPAADVINVIASTACRDTRHRIHFTHAGEQHSLTLAELDAQAVAVARRLYALGVRPRDRVGVMAGNRIEWVLLDLAVLKLGGVTAGFEPGRFDPQRIVADFGLRLLFTTDGPGRGRVRDIAAVGDWAGDAASDGAAPLPPHPGYAPPDICAIKFTSGSTGPPKGLEVTVASVDSSLAEIQRLFAHGDGDNVLTFLGYWFLQQRYWVYSSLVNQHDVTLAGLDDAVAMAQSTSPTVIMGVPGFFEALKARLESAGLPRERAARQRAIQAHLGGRVRYLWTGSARASRAVLEFFNDGAVPLYEGYGLNETCIVAKNHPGAFRLGSVGKVLPNKTVRFDDDGILIVGSRAPVNRRYTWCAPGASEKVFLPTGEVKTYDVGHLDEDGFLFIAGRVDDILTLDTGYNVLGTLVEDLLRAHPDVHDCVLFGNGQPFLSAIISPVSPALERSTVRRHVETVNRGLLAEQRIRGLVVAPERFSIENGLLTAQFKPKRREIHARYAGELAAIYEAGSAAGDAAPGEGSVVVDAGQRRSTSPAAVVSS